MGCFEKQKGNEIRHECMNSASERQILEKILEDDGVTGEAIYLELR